MHARRDTGSAGTLGAVLYADGASAVASEEDWIALVRAIAGGDQIALHELYERAHRLVFTLAVRITRNQATAEELTVDVFHGVWHRAADFDPEAGSVLGWIMNQARSRAIDRVRYEQRLKRVDPGTENPPPAQHAPDEALENRQTTDRLREALSCLTPLERQAIEVSFFSDLTYAETAEHLGEPVGTIKTRIRSGLSKLRHALAGRGT